MIYTFTPNPSLDYIIGVDNYQNGAVNRTAYEKLMPGGKGINVSIVLKNLGISSTALGFCAGFTGEKIKEMLNDKGIISDFIDLKNGNSRINVKIKANDETEINAQGPDVDDNAIDKLLTKIKSLQKGDFLILAGSIPKNLPKTFYKEILSYVSDRVNTVVDATGELLLNTLPFSPFLIKPNKFELEEIFNIKLDNENKIKSAAKKLQEMGAVNVLVSLGGEGAVLLTENNEFYKLFAPKGKVINTTGSGDSMVAGFISGFIEKNDYLYALKRGIASGSASAFSAELATLDEINKIYSML